MNFKPMYNRVLVEQVPAETTTRGGLFIPEAVQQKVNQATVLATGPGRLGKNNELIPMTVQVGDRIMYSPGAGLPIQVEGQHYLVLDEEHEIIAIVE